MKINTLKINALKIHRFNITAAVAAVFLAGALAVPALCAPDTPAPAETLIRQSLQTLHAATSLRAEFEEIDSYPGTHKDLAQRGTIVLARPDRLRIHIQRFRRVTAADPWAASGNDTDAASDGQTYSYAFLHPYSTQISRKPVLEDTASVALRGLPLLAGFFGSVTEGGLLPGQSGPASLLPAETWEGKQYQVVAYRVVSERSGDAASGRAYLGDDLLIHRLILRTETAQGPVTKEWTLHKIARDVSVPASTFVYAAPSDATPLDKSSPQLLLADGSAAPDFTAYDGNGKPVKLSDYRGKTVVVDFWATWCWPCNQSLPHTEEIAQAYHDRGVVVLAVAIWDSQTGFDRWLPKHHYPDIQFARDPQPQGKDTAALYHVSATPTAYVIDGDGKIVRSIAGFAGPSPELKSAIEAALPAKTAQAR